MILVSSFWFDSYISSQTLVTMTKAETLYTLSLSMFYGTSTIEKWHLPFPFLPWRSALTPGLGERKFLNSTAGQVIEKRRFDVYGNSFFGSKARAQSEHAL